MKKFPASKVRVLSLGAGVQSSALLFMFEDGTMPNPPDFAIFADTQAEPESVYTWLKFLQKTIKKVPIYIESKGDLVKDSLEGIGSKKRFTAVPFFIKKSTDAYGKELAEWQETRDKIIQVMPKGTLLGNMNLPRKPAQTVMGMRQCTNDYKIQTIRAGVRRVLGYAPRKHMRHEVEMLIGISTDEAQRMKESRIKWIHNYYPLIAANYSRQDCLDYMKKLDLVPPRSACWMCPYRRDEEWLSLQESDPQDFKRAVEFDREIRTIPKFKHQNFLHRSCIPLDQVVFKPKTQNKQEGFIEECDGICSL